MLDSPEIGRQKIQLYVWNMGKGHFRPLLFSHPIKRKHFLMALVIKVQLYSPWGLYWPWLVCRTPSYWLAPGSVLHHSPAWPQQTSPVSSSTELCECTRHFYFCHRQLITFDVWLKGVRSLWLMYCQWGFIITAGGTRRPFSYEDER